MVTTFTDAVLEERPLQRTAAHVEHAVGGKGACFGTSCVTHRHWYQLRLNKAGQECQTQQAKNNMFHGKMRRAQGLAQAASPRQKELRWVKWRSIQLCLVS